MKPQLIVIETPEAVSALVQYLQDKDYIAYDCETTGLTARHEVIGFGVCAEEHIAYYVVLQKWEYGVMVKLSGMYDAALPLIQLLATKSLIMHNGVFDCMMAESNFKIRLIEALHTDTMILAHLLNENRRVGLKELASTMFGESSTHEQQEMEASILANGGIINKGKGLYELYKADYTLIGKYGAKDPQLTLRLFNQLVPELYKQGLDAFFYDDESMPMLRTVTYELNTTGMQIDLRALTALKKSLEAECAEAKAFIYHEIADRVKERYPGTNKKNGFNIGSNNQLSWLLFGKLELEFATLTKEGKIVCKALGLRLPYFRAAKNDFIAACENRKGKIYQYAGIFDGGKTRLKKIRDPWCYIACDKSTLQKFAPKLKWVDKLLEYNKKQTILNTYVKGIESRVQYGVIYPSFLQHGTTSGRYSSRNPNWQNLPRDDKRVKACVVPRPGKVYVGADQSQLEPRVFAFYSQDPRLLEAFKGADDFYSVIGMHVYDKTDCVPRKDGSPDAFGIKYKKLRDLSKVIALASTYGATAYQLAPVTKKSVEDTAEDIANYFERFPGVATMMKEAHELAMRDGQVVNHFGRPRRMPDAKQIVKLYGKQDHNDLPYLARNLLNLACNHRIQSTGASIMNRAAIRFVENRIKAEIDCRIVVQVHDSLVVECDKADAEDVSVLLQDAMENAVKLQGIDFQAIPKIGTSLAEV